MNILPASLFHFSVPLSIAYLSRPHELSPVGDGLPPGQYERLTSATAHVGNQPVVEKLALMLRIEFLCTGSRQTEVFTSDNEEIFVDYHLTNLMLNKSYKL